MTMLRDQLSSLADSVEVPPAPSLFELERDAGPARRRGRLRLVAAVAATLAVVGGSIVWLSRGADDKPEPAGPPTWSDVDVPWTADGKLHWRDAVIDVEPLTAYAQGKDVLWLLQDGFVTLVRPDGSNLHMASGVQGPVAVDPDDKTIVWSDGRKLTLFYETPDGAATVSSPPIRDALVMSLSDHVVRGLVAVDSSDQSFAINLDGGFDLADHRNAAALDDRAGWLVVTDDRQRLRAISDQGGTIGLGRGEVVGIGPSAEYVAFVDSRGRIVMTALPTGARTPLGLPAGSSPGDFGYRWTSDGDLVMPVTTEPDTEDPVVSWYLCTAPDWGCEAMDVPDQPRSEIPLMANFWTYTMTVAWTRTGGGSVTASASAPAAPETSGQ